MSSKIEMRRIEVGISQTAMARHLGISRQTYAKYEQHPEFLTIQQAKLLCELLDLDFNTLVDLEYCLRAMDRKEGHNHED